MSLVVPLHVRQRARLLLIEQASRAAASQVVTVPASFGEWMRTARPEHRWDYRHFVEMQKVLDDVTAGITRRAYFSIPIRHGKTEHNTISYAAYHLERNPKFKWLVGSYNQRQANKFSREIRRLARARGIPLSKERDAAEEWETEAGGGVRAVGAGGGTASINADGILVDDPIGSRKDAESLATRDDVWDWLTNDILGRAQPHTFVLMTMSRWHVSDPAGRLLSQQAGRWRVLDLPGRALAPAPATETAPAYVDPLGRAEGEVLWPEVLNDAWMTEKRAELLEYGFASLIQGRPRPREGGMFKWDWWQTVETEPTQGRMVRYWDLAGTKKKANVRSHDPDYTAGALLSRLKDKRTCIHDVARFRKAVHERDAELEKICRADVDAYLRKGRRIVWWIETEAGIAGEERTQALVRRLQNCGMPVFTEHPTGDKVLRAEPLASKAGALNVVLAPGAWRDEFRNEAADFPNGDHDDQIDAAAGADAKLDDQQGQFGVGSFSAG